MKNLVKLIILFSLLTSCSKRITNLSFVTIKPESEWEITLKMNEDSTFILEDSFGCNKFYHCGKWQYVNSIVEKRIILTDTIQAKFESFYGAYKVYNRNTNSEELYLPNRYFPVISTDTITLQKNGSEILFRDLIFKRQTIFNRKNLFKTRAIISAHDLVNGTHLSNKEFKRMFGKSKRKVIKEKTKSYMVCHPVPIPMNMHPL